MATEDEILERFEAELAGIATIDRRYYLNPSTTPLDRAAYAVRQAHLEEIRSRFYAELSALKQSRQFRHCRSVIRQSRSRE